MSKFTKPQLTKIDYLLHQLQSNDVHIIISVCMECGEWLGIKDGMGVCGISHGLCGNCLNKLKNKYTRK
jgi:hypothetical protein